MGKGIRTTSGADPLQQWQTRIDNFDSSELSAALRLLLSGGQLTSQDGILEVSSIEITANRHKISVRIPDAPYVADVDVTARVPNSDPDERSPIPSPDNWMSRPEADSDVTWELFNCLMHTLQSRYNKATDC